MARSVGLHPACRCDLPPRRSGLGVREVVAGLLPSPMSMSAELLGLAPGNAWIAGASFIVTTVRARRAALDEDIERSLHVLF